MPISIDIPQPIQQHTNGQKVVSVAGATVKDALEELGKQYPGIVSRLFDNGQMRRFINVYLNEEDIRYLDNLETALKDGDKITIHTAIAGG